MVGAIVITLKSDNSKDASKGGALSLNSTPSNFSKDVASIYPPQSGGRKG